MRTRIKFCGITTEEDAIAAVRFGADALGFVMSKSPRQIDPEKALAIIQTLPPMVTAIGVFVNENADYVERTAEHCKLNIIQLQGSEDLNQYSWKIPIIKAYKVGQQKNFICENFDNRVCAYLFDSLSQNKAGGTGVAFDWNILSESDFQKPVILAGGLNPGNVKDAIRLLRPYAVDVSSGIEKAKGVKDWRLMKEFVQQVRIADEETNTV